jgi:hypothetical protein
MRLPLAALALVAYQFRHGTDAIVRQHDSLDSTFALLGRMSVGDLFSAPSTQIPYLLGGISRDGIGGELHVGVLINVVFPTIWALVLNELLIRGLAFVGMRLLLNRLGLSDRPVIVYTAASLFSLLPFYVAGYGSVAAVPLLLWALVRTYDRKAIDRWTGLALFLIPFYTGVWITLPYLVIVALVVLACGALDRATVGPMLKGGGLLALGTVIVDWRFAIEAVRGEPSHRADQLGGRVPWSRAWDGFVPELLSEPDHAAVGKSGALIVLLLIGLGLLVIARGLLGRRLRRAALWAALAVPGLLLLGRLWRPFEANVIAAVLEDWTKFQLNRVRFAEPTFIYLLLAFAMAAIVDLASRARLRWLRPVSIVVVALLALVHAQSLLDMHEFRQRPDSLTVRQYYAPETFAEVRSAIEDGGGDLAVSVGLHPAVALHNRIDIADGYWVSYPLEYKVRFRRLIAPALELDSGLRAYFDNWGSRAYVFQPAFGRPDCCYARPADPYELIVDARAFSDLRITHVISVAPITNAPELGLTLVLASEHPDERGPILLYAASV